MNSQNTLALYHGSTKPKKSKKIQKMGQVLLKAFPKPDVLIGPAIIFGTLVQIFGAKYLASQLSNPGDLSDIDRCLYFVKFVLPPLVLLQWLVFEYQAIARSSTPGKPWSTELVKESEKNPPFTAKLVRIAQNTFEQSIVTFGANLTLVLYLSKTNAAGIDFRIAIANMILYMISRIFYCNFYLAHPDLRFFPLMIGGFWVNAGSVTYACLLEYGIKDSYHLWYGCIGGFPVMTLVYIVLTISPPSDKKAK